MKDNVFKFNASAKAEILEALGLSKDEEGFIVEKANPSQRVLTPDGEEVPYKKLGVIEKGSLLFTKSDYFSLMNFLLRKIRRA